MRTLKKLVLTGIVCLGVLGLAKVAKAMVVKYNNYLANEIGLTYNKSYPLALNSYGIDFLSFTTISSSVTFSNQTFTDGQTSTGTILVTTVSGLTAVAASNSLIIETTTNLGSATLIVNGVSIPLTQYADITTTASAINIANAIAVLVPNVVVSTGGGSSIYSTATVAGSYGNNMVLSVNVSTNIILIAGGTTANNSSNFSGGKDAAVVTVNGHTFQAGRDFTVTSLTSSTASNLATAINASSNTTFVIAGTTSSIGSLVYTSSTFVGANTNYILASSTQAALTIGGSTVTVQGLNGAGIGQMWGGANASYTLVNGSATVIVIANNAYPLALPVLYTVSGSAITGLSGGTTYYVTNQTGSSLSLAKTSTDAVAGNAIVLTSSQTKTASDTYTLAPLAIAGFPAFKWEVSNDGINWTDYSANTAGITVSSSPMTPYISTGAVRNWDFGSIEYAFIRANVTAPTSGAVKLQIIANGKNSTQ